MGALHIHYKYIHLLRHFLWLLNKICIQKLVLEISLCWFSIIQILHKIFWSQCDWKKKIVWLFFSLMKFQGLLSHLSNLTIILPKKTEANVSWRLGRVMLNKFEHFQIKKQILVQYWVLETFFFLLCYLIIQPLKKITLLGDWFIIEIFSFLNPLIALAVYIRSLTCCFPCRAFVI